MKKKKDKSHVILSLQGNVHVNKDTAQIKTSKCQKFLGIILIHN